MKKLSKENGITLTALAIGVIVIIILASITAYIGKDEITETKDTKAKAELEMVQHAVLEQYVKYKTTKNVDELKGEIISTDEVKNLTGITELPDTSNMTNAEYRKLDAESLRRIGIKSTDDIYIVNYATGEVFNATQKNTSDGSALYLKSTATE